MTDDLRRKILAAAQRPSEDHAAFDALATGSLVAAFHRLVGTRDLEPRTDGEPS